MNYVSYGISIYADKFFGAEKIIKSIARNHNQLIIETNTTAAIELYIRITQLKF